MFDGFLAPRYIGWMIDGLGVTLGLSVLASVIALALGFLLCVLRLSPSRPVAGLAAAWLSVFRNTPLLVQLFFWYFGVSALLPDSLMAWLNAPHRIGVEAFGVPWPPFEMLAGLLGLSLYSAAFMAEEFRAGIYSVAPGQTAAGRALGMSSAQIWISVILPQAVRIARAPLAGQVMNVVKNSSLTMAIGLAELSYSARQVETETFKAFQAFGLATVFYIGAVVLIGGLSQLAWGRSTPPTGTAR